MAGDGGGPWAMKVPLTAGLLVSAQPGCGAVAVQAVRGAQRGDHELDGVLDVPGQLEALRRRPAPGGRELPRGRHHGPGQAGELRGVTRIERPGRFPGRGSQAGDLVAYPGPG